MRIYRYIDPAMDDTLALPKAQSPDLYLTHPTFKKFEVIYSLGFLEWGGALTLPQYLEESAFLTTGKRWRYKYMVPDGQNITSGPKAYFVLMRNLS